MRNQVTVMLRFLALALLLAGNHAARAADDFLDPRAAFKFAARALDERTVEVSFTIAPGYYLYREQFKFEASGATLGVPAIPAGITYAMGQGGGCQIFLRFARHAAGELQH